MIGLSSFSWIRGYILGINRSVVEARVYQNFVIQKLRFTLRLLL